MDETFTLLPLHLDPTSKAISNAATSSSALDTELTTLNALHRTLLTLDTSNQVPPPPVPVNPKRSANITKLRESGNTSFRKGSHTDAIRMYGLAITMALTRPPWEPAGLVRDELSGLYANRAQAQMAMQNWPEGLIDAESSIECKKVGNAKGWWRGARCLVEMGRVDEAMEWVTKGLEFEGKDGDLLGLSKEVEGLLARKKIGK
ncbi:MAG: hypothetical protein M1812_007347 [Candelaria pacifica]|nr:MAG: hypothetical protein M1812_007347 [Candelaria pacifica]